MTTPTPAVAHDYIRVSSPRQKKEGLSMEAQEAKGRAYVLDKKLGEILIYLDGDELGATPFAERPAAAALLKRVKPGDHVIMTKIDRGFRNLGDCLHWYETWSQTGISLHILDFQGGVIDPRTSNGRLMFHMLAALAQWQRDQISERCLEVTQYLRTQGKWTSPNVPYGFKAVKDKNGKGFFAVPDPAQRKIMGQIYEWWAKDGKSHWAIFQHLRANKVPLPSPNRRTKRSLDEWSEPYVRRLCQREAALRAREELGETL